MDKEKAFEDGLKKGEKLGEMNERIRITLKLLKIGMKDKDIAEITGFTIEELEEMKKEMSN